MPFDPDEYLAKKSSPAAQGFDPDKYLASKSAPPVPEERLGEAALEGFGKAATFGHLPQLQAGVAKGIEAITPKSSVDRDLEAQGFTVKPGEQDYAQTRDQMIERQEGLQKQHPGGFLAGQAAGTIATLPAAGKIIPGPTAATALGRVGQASLGGAITGAIENPGDKKGEVSPLQLGDRAVNAGLGFLTGAVGQSVVGEAIPKIGGKLKAFAQEKAVKSSGAMLKDFRRIFGKDRVGELGDAMFEHGLVKPGFTFSDVADKSSQIKQRAGQQIGAIYSELTDRIAANPKKMGELLEFEPKRVIDRLFQSVSDPKVAPNLDRKAYSDTMSKYIDEIASSGKLHDIRYLNDVIGEVSDKVNWSKRVHDLAPAEQGFVALRTELRKMVNEAADKVGNALSLDKVSSDVLKRLNKTYGSMAEISTMAKDRVARNAANRFFSPSDYGAGGVGMAVGAMTGNSPEEKIKNAAMGAGLGVANRAARLYALPALATAAHKAGGLLSGRAASPATVGMASERARKGLLK